MPVLFVFNEHCRLVHLCTYISWVMTTAGSLLGGDQSVSHNQSTTAGRGEQDQAPVEKTIYRANQGYTTPKCRHPLEMCGQLNAAVTRFGVCVWTCAWLIHSCTLVGCFRLFCPTPVFPPHSRMLCRYTTRLRHSWPDLRIFTPTIHIIRPRNLPRLTSVVLDRCTVAHETACRLGRRFTTADTRGLRTFVERSSTPPPLVWRATRGSVKIEKHWQPFASGGALALLLRGSSGRSRETSACVFLRFPRCTKAQIMGLICLFKLLLSSATRLTRSTRLLK